MKDNEMKVKFNPRTINLEPRDLSKLSNLAGGEIIEDPLGRHKKGTPFLINHGDIGSSKFPKIMFPAPNPIEFYLYSGLKNLDDIRAFEPIVKKDFTKVNDLLLKEIEFCIFIVSALEAFINQMIPNNFEYKYNTKIIPKSIIEKEWSIKDKIKKIIQSIFKICITTDYTLWNQLVSLIDLRNDLIHLKTTNSSSDFRSYQDLYRRLLDHDYEESYIVIKKVIILIGRAHKIK